MAQDGKHTITVGIYLSVTVDLDELNAEYGTNYTVAEAREDVKASAFNAVAQTMYPQEALDKIVIAVAQKS